MPGLGPEIVNRQAVIGTCVLSPDGQLVAYTRRVVAKDEYRTDLWLVPYRGGRPRRLTSAPATTRRPRSHRTAARSRSPATAARATTPACT